MSLHRFISLGLVASLVASCTLIPSTQTSQGQRPQAAVEQAAFQVKQDSAEPEMVTFPNMVTPQPVASVAAVPAGESLALDFVTSSPTAQQVKMPANGEFEVKVQAGPQFAVLDNDATDGLAVVQMPAQVMDIYLRPEASGGPATCPTPGPSVAPTQMLDNLDQVVLDKANSLIAAGQGQCVYLPPLNQRQNANCNTNGSGLQCSGPLNKTIVAANCPEIAVYGGAMNINNALPNSKLFVAVQNNLTINQSVTGLLSTRGDLNTSLNNQSLLDGVFVGARSNNLNMGGSTRIQGLYAILNAGSLSMNLNQNAVFDGELCTSGSVNLNRNGSSQLIYNPNRPTPWQSDVPQLSSLMCAQGTRPYTQTIAQDCGSAAPNENATIKLEDSLYYINQTLASATDNSWHQLLGRPLPVPADWYSPDGQIYILKLTNQGMSVLKTRWQQAQQKSFPVGMKEIGPEGGIVELPGVAKLELPAGALMQTMVVKLTQLREAPFRGQFKLPPQYSRRHDSSIGFEYASPVIRIEPFKQKLLNPASLSVLLLDYRYKFTGLSFINDLSIENIFDTSKGYKEIQGRNRINAPIVVSDFLYHGKMVTYGWLKRFLKDNPETFQVQQTTNENQEEVIDFAHETPHFLYESFSTKTTKEELTKLGYLFEKIYSDYKNILNFTITTGFYTGDNRPVVKVFRTAEDYPEEEQGAGWGPSKACWENSNKDESCKVEIHLLFCGGVEENEDSRCPSLQNVLGKAVAHELVHHFQHLNQAPITHHIYYDISSDALDSWFIEGGAGWIGDNYIQQYLQDYTFVDGPITDIGNEPTHLRPWFAIYPFDADSYTEAYANAYGEPSGSLYHVKKPFFFHAFQGQDKFQDMKFLLDNFGKKIVRKNLSNNEKNLKSFQTIHDRFETKQSSLQIAYADFAKDALLVRNMGLKERPFDPVPLISEFNNLPLTIDETHTCQNPLLIPVATQGLQTSFFRLTPGDNINDEKLVLSALKPTIEQTGPTTNTSDLAEDYLNVSAIGIDHTEQVAEFQNDGIVRYNATEFDNLYDIRLRRASDRFAVIPKFGQNVSNFEKTSQSAIVVASDARWKDYAIPCVASPVANNEDIKNYNCSQRPVMRTVIQACLAPQIYSALLPDIEYNTPDYRKILAKRLEVKGRFLDENNTQFMLEHLIPTAKPLIAQAEFVESTLLTDGLPLQTFRVVIPTDAKPGGGIHAVVGNVSSNKIDLSNLSWPCSSLSSADSFVLSSQKDKTPCHP